MPILGTGKFTISGQTLFSVTGNASSLGALPAGSGYTPSTYVVGQRWAFGAGPGGWTVILLGGTHAIISLSGYLGGAYFIDNAPAGFTPTTNLRAVSVGSVGSAGLKAGDTMTVQYANAISTLTGPTSSTPALVLADNTSLVELIASPWTASGSLTFFDSNTGSSQSGDFLVTGNYSIVTYDWYFNPVTNHYQYSSTDPGAPWTILTSPSAPVPRFWTPTAVLDLISDSGGSSSGLHQSVGTALHQSVGTAVLRTPPTRTDLTLVTRPDPAYDPPNPTHLVPYDATSWVEPSMGCAGTVIGIFGTGFGDGATVTVGGVAATDVEVLDQDFLFATTGAHADGLVDVVVTNADGVSTTSVNAYTYATPWWELAHEYYTDGVLVRTEYSYVQLCVPPWSDTETDAWTLRTPDPLTLDLFVPGYTAVDDRNGWYLAAGPTSVVDTSGWIVDAVDGPFDPPAPTAPDANGWFRS